MIADVSRAARDAERTTLLWDVGVATAAALRWVELGGGAHARLRLAELVRRTDARQGAALIGDPSGWPEALRAEARRVAAACAIGLGRAAYARRLGAEVDPRDPGGWVLRARLAHLDDPAAGVAALASDPFEPGVSGPAAREALAEAMWLRGRWTLELGDAAAAARAFAGLGRLAQRYDAPLTAATAEAGATAAARLGEAAFEGPPAAAVAEIVEALMIEGGVPEPDSPLPAWLQGLVSHARALGDPRVIGNLVALLAGLRESAGQLEAAWAALCWGRWVAAAALGPDGMGPDALAALDAQRGALQARLGPARVAAFDAALVEAARR